MDKGSIFALLGSNGAGKTTFVKEDYLLNNGTLDLMKPRINVR
jgi:ABC-type Mn2+/Zn2+ transport system ATPase subunit